MIRDTVLHYNGHRITSVLFRIFHQKNTPFSVLPGQRIAGVQQAVLTCGADWSRAALLTFSLAALTPQPPSESWPGAQGVAGAMGAALEKYQMPVNKSSNMAIFINK